MVAENKTTVPTGISVKIAEHFGLVAAGVSLLIVLLGYVFLFAPALRKVRDANQTQQLQQEIAGKTIYLANLKELKANYDKIPTDDVQKIKDMIPFSDDLPGLTVEFDALAKKNDVALTSITFSGGIGEPGSGAAPAPPAAPAPGVPAGLSTLIINVSLEHADYARIKLFLESLEHHLRIFEITSMSFDPAGATYVMAIKTYVHAPVAH